MSQNTNSHLTDKIIQKFKIVYSDLLFENIILFKNSEKKYGVLTSKKKFGLFTSYCYLVKPIYNYMFFYKELKLIRAEKHQDNDWDMDKKTHYYFDLNGVKIWESKKDEFISIDNFDNIFLSV